MVVVGIGASAGGLQAITEFFQHKRKTQGESYILVVHSVRTHKPKLAQILARIVEIPISLIEDGMVIKPDHIYVSPPSHFVNLEDGMFRLIERPDNELINQSVNHFFKSLSSFAKEQAIGIIMSGTGTDGTAGAYDIESRDGVVIVQDPETAQFDGMPLTSIRYDHPDYILAPREMPELIDRISAGKEDKTRRRNRSLSNFKR